MWLLNFFDNCDCQLIIGFVGYCCRL